MLMLSLHSQLIGRPAATRTARLSLCGDGSKAALQRRKPGLVEGSRGGLATGKSE
jgi:hypothetical protein|eukprot:SAG25_NODE_182_length_12512_cov_80.886732_5_plen_55_part_00